MTIKIIVTDEEMKLLQEAAERQGISVEQAAHSRIFSRAAPSISDSDTSRDSKASFESCFGMFNGELANLTNQDIDRLVADEYADHHDRDKR